MTNDYLPAKLSSEVFLRKAGDLTGKEWDEVGLREWEQAENGGERWEGRDLVDFDKVRS